MEWDREIKVTFATSLSQIDQSPRFSPYLAWSLENSKMSRAKGQNNSSTISQTVIELINKYRIFLYLQAYLHALNSSTLHKIPYPGKIYPAYNLTAIKLPTNVKI